MPLFPIIIAFLGKGIGVKLFNVFCGTLIVGISYFFTLNALHSRLIAIAAALITSFYPYYVYLSITGLSEPLYSLIVYLSITLLYLRQYNLCFLLATLSILIRPFFELIFPIIMVLFFVFEEKRTFILSSSS